MKTLTIKFPIEYAYPVNNHFHALFTVVESSGPLITGVTTNLTDNTVVLELADVDVAKRLAAVGITFYRDNASPYIRLDHKTFKKAINIPINYISVNGFNGAFLFKRHSILALLTNLLTGGVKYTKPTIIDSELVDRLLCLGRDNVAQSIVEKMVGEIPPNDAFVNTLYPDPVNVGEIKNTLFDENKWEKPETAEDQQEKLPYDRPAEFDSNTEWVRPSNDEGKQDKPPAEDEHPSNDEFSGATLREVDSIELSEPNPRKVVVGTSVGTLTIRLGMYTYYPTVIKTTEGSYVINLSDADSYGRRRLVYGLTPAEVESIKAGLIALNGKSKQTIELVKLGYDPKGLTLLLSCGTNVFASRSLKAILNETSSVDEHEVDSPYPIKSVVIDESNNHSLLVDIHNHEPKKVFFESATLLGTKVNCIYANDVFGNFAPTSSNIKPFQCVFGKDAVDILETENEGDIILLVFSK